MDPIRSFIIDTESSFHETPALSKQWDQRVSVDQTDFKWQIVTYAKAIWKLKQWYYQTSNNNLISPCTLLTLPPLYGSDDFFLKVLIQENE